MQEDTIVAISTALSNSAISIVRMSGKESISIASKIFKGKNLEEVKSNTINYGYIVDKDKIIDEVLVSIMRAPHTYTKEDIVEINTHGGIIPTNNVLNLLIKNGARMAEPGEFTKRAFLNGRIDLTQAEAVMDIIESKTNYSNELALKELTGDTKKYIQNLRQRLINLISQIEVNIDYPEYQDIEQITYNKIQDEVRSIKNELEIIIDDSKNIKIIKEGITTLILGKPNVGKSSLLNKLIKEEKAIVTEIEGTTRDIVEGQINLNGIILNLIDTAGIRQTDNKIEQIGIQKSKDKIKEADLVIVVLDISRKMSQEDIDILEATKDKTRIIVLNKNDLKQELELDKKFMNENIIEINTLKEINIKPLKDIIKQMFELGKIEDNKTLFANQRQINNAMKAKQSLENVLNTIDSVPVDLLEIDIKDALYTLGEITGENYNDEILDNLFKNFCVGK